MYCNNFPLSKLRPALVHLICCYDAVPSSGLKAQLYKGLIYHRQRYGKLKAKAMLTQHCPPCLLVRGTAALHWIRLMCSRYLPVNNITSSENSQCVFTDGKQILREQTKLPCYLSISALQEDLCTQYCLFAEWKSTRHIVRQEQFIKLVCAVRIDCQCPHAQKNESAEIFTQEEYKSLPEMSPCCKKV